MDEPFTETDFWARVDDAGVPGVCWTWTGSISPNGYGRFSKEYAHRVAYRWFVDPSLPKGIATQIDHLCRNRLCVNPSHLEAVTQRENILRGTGTSARHARQTHCIHGHEFTPENTYIRRDNGARQCRVCARERDDRHHARIR